MAEKREIKPWSWAMIMVLLVLFLGVGRNEAAPSAAECKLERRLGINACKPVLYGNSPSPDCCYRIRVTDIECVCPVITPQLAALVGDVNRAIRIIESCGRSVPSHVKCGSKFPLSVLYTVLASYSCSVFWISSTQIFCNRFMSRSF